MGWFDKVLARAQAHVQARQQREAVPAGDAEAQRLIGQGNAAEDAGRLPEAIALYRQAAALAPTLPAAHLNLGIALEAAGDAAAARAAYELVLALEPGHAPAAYNLGKLDYLQDQLRPAEALLRRAIASRPAFVQAWVLLSNVLDARGDTQGAADAIARALELQPDDPGALFNQASILRRLGRLDAAADAALQSTQLAPGEPQSLALLVELLHAQGFAAEALVPLRAAIAVAPQRLDLRSRELFLLNLVDGVPAQSLYERHLQLGREVEASVPARPAAPRQRGARLRVGFVSEDFRFHPVALFLLPLLEHRDRERFELWCYSSTLRADEITRRVQGLCDHWVDVRQLHDLEIAEAIARDGIDVLVDLGGHAGSMVRLGVFAARPAPVQLAWMGYLNTTGLTRMDGRITDARSDPPAAQALHTERLLYLPHSQWCYRPFIDVAPAARAPCEQGGAITFGSFNNAAKLTEAHAARWGRILQAVPGARLLVAGVDSARKQQQLLAALQAQGAEPQRVEFAPRLDLAAYYALYHRVDIALDSHPYGGGTTTFDALWMGVPVLTALGELPASRSAASVLGALGLDEWVAPSIAGYEALAIERARDVAALGDLRRTLRARLQASPLMDEPAFVRELQRLLEQAAATGPASA